MLEGDPAQCQWMTTQTRNRDLDTLVEVPRSEDDV